LCLLLTAAKATQGQLLHYSHAPEDTEGPSEFQQEQDLVLIEGRWFHTVYCAKHSHFLPTLILAEAEEEAMLPVPALSCMVTWGLWEQEGTAVKWAGSGHGHNICPNPTLGSKIQVVDTPWGTK